MYFKDISKYLFFNTFSKSEFENVFDIFLANEYWGNFICKQCKTKHECNTICYHGGIRNTVMHPDLPRYINTQIV